MSEDKEDGEDRDDEDEAEDGDDADGTDGARMDLASSSGMPRITLSGGGSAEVSPWAPLLAEQPKSSRLRSWRHPAHMNS